MCCLTLHSRGASPIGGGALNFTLAPQLETLRHARFSHPSSNTACNKAAPTSPAPACLGSHCHEFLCSIATQVPRSQRIRKMLIRGAERYIPDVVHASEEEQNVPERQLEAVALTEGTRCNPSLFGTRAVMELQRSVAACRMGSLARYCPCSRPALSVH